MSDTPFFDARHKELGEILLRTGVITEEQLQQGLQRCASNRKDLGQALIDLGITSEDKIMKAVSMRLGIPCFLSFEGMMEADAASLIPEPVVRRLLMVPLYRTEDALIVGMSNPLDVEALDEVARLTGLHVRPVMTSLANMMEVIQNFYMEGELPGGAASDDSVESSSLIQMEPDMDMPPEKEH